MSCIALWPETNWNPIKKTREDYAHKSSKAQQQKLHYTEEKIIQIDKNFLDFH